MKIRSITALAASAVLAICIAGCRGESTKQTAAEPAPPSAQLVQEDGHEYLLLKQSDVPGMSFAQVKDVALPGILETTGQVTFDDQRVSTIVSRVQGRIEEVQVSLWDSVGRGEPIVKLYSPDFMTAEAEYLQALTTSKVSQGTGIDGGVDMAASMASAAKRKLELLGMEEGDINALKAPSPSIWMRAPISGTVVKNQALRGAAINPGDVLYMLGTLDPSLDHRRSLRSRSRARARRPGTRSGRYRVSRSGLQGHHRAHQPQRRSRRRIRCRSDARCAIPG